jgi:transmembrane sensor
MSTDARTSEGAGLRRLQEASDWLLRMDNSNRTEEDVNEWLRWCDEDPENLLAFEAFQRDWRDLDALKVDIDAEGSALAPRVVNDVLILSALQKKALLEQESPRPSISRMQRRKLTVRLAMAACLALVALAVILLLPHERDLSIPRQQVAATQTNRAATLPDGSRIILSAQTSINVDFNGSKRNLELSAGEAYFKVKHDRRHPFIVHAGDISVTAVGTAFDVRREADGVTVTVEEGTVEIAGNVFAKQGLPATWRADAGYRLTYSSQGRTAKITSVDTSSVLEWRGGELAYVWEPLGAVIEDLNRYSQHKVIIKDPAIAELRFTGTVFTASVADWVKAIEQAYPVRADSTANGDIVLVDRR